MFVSIRQKEADFDIAILYANFASKKGAHAKFIFALIFLSPHQILLINSQKCNVNLNGNNYK